MKQQTRLTFACGIMAFLPLVSMAMQYNELVTVGAGEVLDITENTTFAKGLAGEGTVRNSTATEYQLIFKGGTRVKPVVFNGKLEGKFAFVTYGEQHLAGTGSMVTGAPEGYQNGGFGLSSFNFFSGNLIDRTGLRLVYLGEQGETVAKNATLMNSGSGMFEIDAGAYGGLTFTGIWQTHPNVPWQRQLTLTGSNSVESVFAGQLVRRVNANSATGGYSFHVIKDGTGVWKFCKTDPASNTEPFSGAMTIKDGTLRFDSLAEKGVNCALGTALDLYEAKNGTGDDPASAQVPDAVPYAYQLGSATGDATLEYAGTADVKCSTRPLAINSKGRLANDVACRFNFSDVYPNALGTNVLTLAGDNDASQNVVSGLDDRRTGAAGDLSIVKVGSGTWQISGANDIHGSVAVREGVLVLKNRYTWYRVNVKATVGYNPDWRGSDTGLQVIVEELGLYAADGTRVNKNLKAVTTYPALGEGEVANGFETSKWTPKEAVANIAYLCDDTASAYKQWYYLADGWYDTDGVKQTGSVIHWHPTQASAWYPIVMRLPDDAPTAVGYDISTSGAATTPSIWSVDASMDGVNWTTIEPDYAITATKSGWQMAGRAHAAGGDDKHLDADGNPDMKLFANAAVADGFMSHVESYSVSDGAMLKILGDVTIGKLVVDPDDAGVIEGGTLAANGTIVIESDEKLTGVTTLPLDLSKVGGLENLPNWTVSVKGNLKKWSVSVVDGKIVLTPPGMMLILR